MRSPEVPPAKRVCITMREQDAAETLFAMATSQGCSNAPVIPEQPHSPELPPPPSPPAPPTTQDKASQTVYDRYMLNAKIEMMVHRNDAVLKDIGLACPTDLTPKPGLSFEMVKNDPVKIKYFSGLTMLHFTALFTFLGDLVQNLNYWNSGSATTSGTSTKKGPARQTEPLEELFLTLVRLRRGYDIPTMSHMFSISPTHIRTIFITWIQLLYHHFNDVRHLMFPDRAHLKRFLPRSFKSFRNVRCSVDCTEFFVQMPRNLTHQSNLYSSYKHHHTFKCLLAVAPNGTIVYVSNVYEGSMSDVKLFEDCGILEKLHPGDMLLVNRGFTIQELLNPYKVTINIPPFLGKRDKLTPQEELLTRRIAKARIHVERANERVKKFRLLSGTLPLSLSPYINQLVFVTCCLVNFQDLLVR